MQIPCFTLKTSNIVKLIEIGFHNIFNYYEKEIFIGTIDIVMYNIYNMFYLYKNLYFIVDVTQRPLTLLIFFI